ncbi:MAG: Hsp20/alpha crystallin family protein [Acidobacteria bacterium]|nr:Hsp20/alpha crystallin family protein [Acidobacteriota bacterium]MCA1650920.1 Hsp20/alpha crystallin family protein [Acidobacteriota bacterium]
MPWDPMRDLRVWQERLERLSSHHAESWTPPTDVYETPDRYVIRAELPGLVREQINIALEDTRLTISGQRPDNTANGGNVTHYHQVERGHGAFSRTFEFADKIDAESVSAHLADGVLTITLTKVPTPPARQIAVR